MFVGTNGNATFDRCTMNNSFAEEGAALYTSSNVRVQFRDSRLLNGDAKKKGGAICSGTRSTLLLDFTEFRNNLAGYGSYSYQQGEGGSVYADTDTVINAKNCIFQNTVLIQK